MDNFHHGQQHKRSLFSRFLDRFAIPNLSLVIILCYGFGYLLQYVNSAFLDYLTLNPYEILHGQIWRLITWVLVPPDSSNIFFILIAMLFYYSIGTSLERTWGIREYNAYIWTGIGLTIVGAFAAGAVLWIGFQGYGDASAELLVLNEAIGRYFSTYYVSTSIFLAYALTFPDAVVLLWFIIPIKVKWMIVVYGIVILHDFVNAARYFIVVSGYEKWKGLFLCISMVASLANFMIFWLRGKKLKRFSPGEIRRRSEFRRAVQRGAQDSPQAASKMRPGYSVARHRCAICGKTELDDPTAEFRYCSKCQSSYEFCQDHLFCHQHAVNGSGPLPAEASVTIERNGALDENPLSGK